MKQCLIYFGGVVNEGAGQFSFQAGTNPSRCTIRTRLGVIYPQIGDLVITDGTVSRTFPRCRVVRHSIQRVQSGRMREIIIEDRRWEWSRAKVWGEYNSREKGVIQAGTKKSARDLASICLTAMGESQFDVTALPDNAYPEVTWDAENATDALDAICSEFGCIAGLRSATNTAKVWRNNDGNKPLVDARAMDGTPSSEPQVVPPLLIFEGGATRWQVDLPLEPVGIEKMANESEVLRPIDQLTYKPANGWGKENPKSFYGVAADQRDLARRCIWRMFRVKPPFDLIQPPHGIKTSGSANDTTAEDLADFFQVKEGELWRILPLEAKQVSAAGVDVDNDPRDAKLLGAFATSGAISRNNIDASTASWATDLSEQVPDNDELVYQDGFSIDTARGLVTTGQPVYYLENNERRAPYLRLRTSFGLRHRDTRAFVSQQYRYIPPSPTVGAITPDLVKNVDVHFEILATPDPSAPADSLTTAAAFTALAEVYLEERMAALYPDEALTVPYRGFVFDYDVDGAIRTVSWSTGPGGGTTVVDYAIERPDLRLTRTQLLEKSQQLSLARDMRASAKRVKAFLRNQKRGVQQ